MNLQTHTRSQSAWTTTNISPSVRWEHRLHRIISLFLIVTMLVGCVPAQPSINTAPAVTTNPIVPSLSSAPDLSLTAGDMTFTPESPMLGTDVSIAVTIHNVGGQTTTAASLVVTDTTVLDNVVVATHPILHAIQNLAPAAQTTVRYTAAISGSAGMHMLCTQITGIQGGERNLANNQACRAITVRAAQPTSAGAVTDSSVVPQSVSFALPAQTPSAVVQDAHVVGPEAQEHTAHAESSIDPAVNPVVAVSQGPAPGTSTGTADVPSTLTKPFDATTMPLAFVPNRGQTDSATRFTAQGLGGTLFFNQDEVVLAIPAESNPAPLSAKAARPDTQHDPADQSTAVSVVHLRLDGAAAASAVAEDQQLSGKVNYFTGSDSTNWKTDLPAYGSIVYPQVYPGIDLHYAGTDGHLKGTYTVAAGPTRTAFVGDTMAQQVSVLMLLQAIS